MPSAKSATSALSFWIATRSLLFLVLELEEEDEDEDRFLFLLPASDSDDESLALPASAARFGQGVPGGASSIHSVYKRLSTPSQNKDSEKAQSIRKYQW